MASQTMGIDIGTGSIKGVVVDEEGRVSRSLSTPSVRSDWKHQVEHDAYWSWAIAPKKVFEELHRKDIEAVCVTAMSPSLCAVDGYGTPISPGLLYGDVRGRPTIASTNDPSNSGECARLLKWLAYEYPEAQGYWPAQAVANFALSDRPVLDWVTAFTLRPLFSGEEWDAEEVGMRNASVSQMPIIEPFAGIGGQVAGVPLASGGIDAITQQIVADLRQVGDVLVICGSSLVIWIVTETPMQIPGLWSVPHTTPGLYLVGGASTAGGLFVDWVTGIARDTQSRTVDPNSVPVWLPYLRGERTPLHDPLRTGHLADLEPGHGPNEIVRAAYEATGFVVRHHIELSGIEPRRLIVGGGGIQSAPWIQAIADSVGIPVLVQDSPFGAAMGAAFLARMAIGLEDSLESAGRWFRVEKTVEPAEDWREAIDSRYGRYRQLVELTSG